MVKKNKNIEKKSFEDFLNNLIPELVEINEFMNSINIDRIYNKTTYNAVSRFKKASDKNVKPKIIQFSY